jgi:tripartite-type tricarboxylate transporter receptor subunit TctC
MRPFLASLFAILGLCTSALAQADYPTRPIALVVPYAAGGPSDVIARLIGQSMSATLGQQIVIENVAGAGGTTGAARVAEARPDGYTLLIHHLALAAGHSLYGNLRYATLQAFEPIGLVNYGPFVLTGKPAFPAQTIAQALATIRENRDRVTMAHAGVGSGSHLCNMLIQPALGVKVTEVAYRGTGPALNDVVGGQVDLLCDQTTNAIPQIQGGRVKAYAVTSAERNDQLKDLPTMQEAGLPGFEITQWHALYAPHGTPRAIVARLSAALEKALGEPSIVARFADLGTVLFPADRRGPAETRAYLRREVEKWERVVHEAGVKPQQ